jgi:hypothetical protein
MLQPAADADSARATCSASRIHDCANVSQKALFSVVVGSVRHHDCANVSQKALFLLLSEACAIATHCSANFR